MSDKPAKPVLLTGASGALGRTLTKSLSAAGWALRLTDIVPFPDAVPTGANCTRADLNDGVTIMRLAEGCGAIWTVEALWRMTWWKEDARGRIGWQPTDSADSFAGQLAGKVSGNPVSERYMGGGFCAIDYSRDAAAPQKLFD